MITFKTYIQEGGNVKVGGVEAQPINITKNNRSTVTGDVEGMLHHLHNSFHKEHGEHLFGEHKKALTTGSAYSGSTKHLFNHDISHDDFAKSKKSVGDIDVQVPKEHMEKLHGHLSAGRRFGKYTVVGVKRGGGEHHALMRHDNGEVHQVDFEGVDYKDHEPTPYDRFSHSSDWHDAKSGIKGVHHKLLLNAVGLDKHKYSSLHGLGKREGEPGWEKDTKKISHSLFGQKANHEDMHSFHGLTQLIKKHVPAEHHQAIYDKFKNDVSLKNKGIDHTGALSHLRQHLNVKDSLNESVQEHHTSVIPLTGFSPISHMGHAKDLGGALDRLPGQKIVGMSKKADVYTPEERAGILHRQWGGKVKVHPTTSGGETVAHAYHSLPEGKKHLHILVGHDRKDFAEGLKSSLEAGKIKEMNGHKFDSIHIHYPEDTDRSHGMSGTKLREAASKGDIDTFHKHLGTMFSRKEAVEHMRKVREGLNSGKVKVKR